MIRPPPPEEPGRSLRIVVYEGKGRRCELVVSLVSCRQAMRMDLEWRRVDISWWEFWIPLQLNCNIEPSEWTGGGGGDGDVGDDDDDDEGEEKDEEDEDEGEERGEERGEGEDDGGGRGGRRGHTGHRQFGW